VAEDPLAPIDRRLRRNLDIRVMVGAVLVVGLAASGVWLATVGLWALVVGSFIGVAIGAYSVVRFWNGDNQPEPLPPGPRETR